MLSRMESCWVVLMLVLAYCSSGHAKLRSLHGSPAEGLNWDGGSTQQGHWKPIEQVEDELIRVRRQSGAPVPHGEHQFNDGNNYAVIHYSGSSSPVILVLTFRFSQIRGFLGNSNLYRSIDYGATFVAIEGQLDETQNNPSLWRYFFVSPQNKNQIVMYSATEAKLYYSLDEGATWTTQALSPSTINPRSLLWNPSNDRMALAHDTQNDKIYVTRNLGQSWTKIADYVESSSDYQWGDPAYDDDVSVVYFNTYDTADANRGNFTVSLRTQRVPYNSATLREFDPNLGRHDDFLLLGPYIFAQKTDSHNMINLYVSYNRQPFQKAMIPTTDPHQNYIVSHIDELQALVIVEHLSGRFNLYLSDITGVYFSQSLPDIVLERNSGVDLELIEGVNGTLIANQNVASGTRTLISLDNGGNWELVRSPAGANCVPPQCSLHFHMTTSDYARTGVYSQASAPGLILAHGNTGSTLNVGSPDLYISRDGGVTWSRTLQGSWGVTVADHGGLLVAAKDYHQTPSTELRYSCDEGLTWRTFTFSTTGMTVYGVLTEPGEHTTTVSLYGIKQGTSTWDVITVNFSSIFPSTCSPSDYYVWHPWDDRIAQDCILGSSVSIERRNISICCLIGEDYDRPISISICPCFNDDFECDYGYMRSDGFTGPCIRDNSIDISPTSCTNESLTYSESQGYRKVAGDVCAGGVEFALGPVTRPCCIGTVVDDPCHSQCIPGVSTCVSSGSGYGCQCVPGYSKASPQPFAPCLDVNECTSVAAPCAEMATCVNTVGSFQCTCNSGYVGDGRHCYNINECLVTPPPCDAQATCTDTFGSFDCTCLPGFTGNGLATSGGTGCSNVNECASRPCDSNAQCTDTIGSFQCTCNQGFVGNGEVCSQLPPQSGCDTSSPCATDAICSMANGGYACQCKPGYTGDGFKTGTGCNNIKECELHPCSGSATCTDTDGSFFCSCPNGFVGDGLVSGSGCSHVTAPASNATNASLSSSGPTIGLIVVSILLVLSLACAILLGLLALRFHHKLKSHSSPQDAAGIRYRNTAADEQPLVWNAPSDDQDDDDEPLLT